MASSALERAVLRGQNHVTPSQEVGGSKCLHHYYAPISCWSLHLTKGNHQTDSWGMGQATDRRAPLQGRPDHHTVEVSMILMS